MYIENQDPVEEREIKGPIISRNKSVYVGEVHPTTDLKDGFGVSITSNMSVYYGEFKEGFQEGKGTMVHHLPHVSILTLPFIL